MLSLAENIPEKEAAELVKSALDDGRAYEKMKEWIAVQGGDPAHIECPSLFPESSVIAPFYSEEEGYLCRMDAEQIGLASLLLGAGRSEKDGKIDHSAGILLKKKPGEFVKTGEVLALFHISAPSPPEGCRKSVFFGFDLRQGSATEKTADLYRDSIKDQRQRKVVGNFGVPVGLRPTPCQ